MTIRRVPPNMEIGLPVSLAKHEKLFGVGPLGAAISILLLGVCLWADHAFGHPHLGALGAARAVGTAFLLAGAGLYAWTFLTLRNWWLRDQLCTAGPFRFFRHPMYASLITFAAPGLALYFNSWFLLIWSVLLHPLWHRLVVSEERLMEKQFGDVYREYTSRTGRFVPRLRAVHFRTRP